MKQKIIRIFSMLLCIGMISLSVLSMRAAVLAKENICSVKDENFGQTRILRQSAVIRDTGKNYAKVSLDETGSHLDRPTSMSEWNNPFEDVKKEDWFFDNVRYVSENQYMSGMSATTFAPNACITRAMLVTILWRVDGKPKTNDSVLPFCDTMPNEYYVEAVRWAAKNKIVFGAEDHRFMPNSYLTREQLATILFRYASYKGYDTSVGENTNILSYTDYDDISEYAISAMQYSVGSGLMVEEKDTTLRPKECVTRAQMAAIAQKFIEENL